MVEANVSCVLDFFVRETWRRQGIGKMIFETMLRREGLSLRGGEGACRLAYDRPSGKLISFLQRHYCLRGYSVQPNKFAFFDEFWNEFRGVYDEDHRGRKANPICV